MDARQVRSRNALSVAILELATVRAVDSLTVSEVAERAGVHRSTFYEHATSPVELLQSVLREQLDTVREQSFGGVDDANSGTAAVASTEGVLAHVDRYDVIYERGLGASSGSGSLHAMLSEHFRESARQLQKLDAFSVPLKIRGISAAETGEAVAAYVSGGAVGAIQVWLTTSKPREPSAFLDLFAALSPSWWPTVGNVESGNLSVAAGR